MHDSISRQAAIDALSKAGLINYAATGDGNGMIQAVNVIKGLPSIQPKRGKWIYGEDEYGIDGYHCDKCGFFVPWDYTHTFINYITDYNFCPSCGAEMSEGGKDALN